MQLEGLLLVRDMTGDWSVLDCGFPTDIRQKFKALVASGAQGYSEIRYTSPRGDMKRKVYRKRMTQAAEIVGNEPENDEIEEYTGEEDKQPANKRTQKGK